MTREETEKEWIRWQRDLNSQLKGTQYLMCFVPPEDLMPYEHGRICTELQDRILRLKETQEENGGMATFDLEDEKETDVIDMALTVYKSILLEIHGERIRREVREQNNEKKGKGKSAGKV